MRMVVGIVRTTKNSKKREEFEHALIIEIVHLERNVFFFFEKIIKKSKAKAEKNCLLVHSRTKTRKTSPILELTVQVQD